MRRFSKDALIDIFDATVISITLKSQLIQMVNLSVAIYITASDDQFGAFYELASHHGLQKFDTWGASEPLIVIILYDSELIPIIERIKHEYILPDTPGSSIVGVLD